MMDYKRYLFEQEIEAIQEFDYLKSFDEFDLQDLCSLLKEPIKNVNSCVSKGQLKTLCRQLLVENVALRKMIIKQYVIWRAKCSPLFYLK